MSQATAWSAREVWTRKLICPGHTRYDERGPLTPRMAMLTVAFALLLAAGAGVRQLRKQPARR